MYGEKYRLKKELSKRDLEVMMMNRRKATKSIRWNDCDDRNVIEAKKTNDKNEWTTDRVNVTADRVSWTKLTEEQQRQFTLTFLILSRIDSEQGHIGMDYLADLSPDNYVGAVFRKQSAMEMVHSESYNRQLATFIPLAKELEYTDWVDNAEEVNDVIELLIYRMIEVAESYEQDVAYTIILSLSTILESYLFYLLFYYPLYLANEDSKMTKCAEVVRLILR